MAPAAEVVWCRGAPGLTLAAGLWRRQSSGLTGAGVLGRGGGTRSAMPRWFCDPNAFAQLRKRLSGLRAELAQLMAPTDDRWYAFGFRRPADGKLPAPVETVTLSAGAAGVVLVNWPRPSGAENYRVSWRRSNSADPATEEETIVADTQFALTSLPSGENVIVGVTARNRYGESAVAEARIRVT